MRSTGLSTRWRQLETLAKICALIWTAVVLIGCATMTASGGGTDPLGGTGPPAGTESPAGADKLGRAAFCDVAEPIAWSALDTDGTIRQAKEHNAVGTRLCGWGKSDR